MAWYNGMIDCNSIKNREGGKRSSSSSYDWNLLHQSDFSFSFLLCFSAPYSSLFYFILFYFIRYSLFIIHSKKHSTISKLFAHFLLLVFVCVCNNMCLLSLKVLCLCFPHQNFLFRVCVCVCIFGKTLMLILLIFFATTFLVTCVCMCLW